MIGGYYCTFRDSIFSIYHCICNCVPDMMRWGEMREIAAVFAPKPMLIIAGTRDTIFPIAATRRAFRELAEVYELLGAPGNLDRDFFNGPARPGTTARRSRSSAATGAGCDPECKRWLANFAGVRERGLQRRGLETEIPCESGARRPPVE